VNLTAWLSSSYGRQGAVKFTLFSELDERELHRGCALDRVRFNT